MTTIYVNRETNLPARRPCELYPTERNLIRAALTRYALALPFSPGYILDPGAGDGRWGQEAKTLYPGSVLHGVERRGVPQPDGFDRWFRYQNFLDFEPGIQYGLICGNPPYGPVRDDVTEAERFIRHGWKMLAGGGRMLYLLPLQFQAGIDRYEGLWATHPPTVVAVCARRPSFGKNSKGRRGTNGTDYGVFVWDKDFDGQPVGTPRRWPTELLIYEPDQVEAPETAESEESNG